MKRQRLHVCLLLVLAQLIASCAAPHPQILLLPEDQAEFDSLQVRGTTTFTVPAGLYRLSVQGTGGGRYVIDRRRGVQKQVMDQLARMPFSADITIAVDQGLVSHVTHLQLDANENGLPQAAWLHFEEPLLSQVYSFFEANGHPDRRGSVEYVRHNIPIGDCPDLPAAIAGMRTVLVAAAGNIGREELQEITVDGIGFDLQVRLGTFFGNFAVTENAGELFNAIASMVETVHDCSLQHPGSVETIDFFNHGMPVVF